MTEWYEDVGYDMTPTDDKWRRPYIVARYMNGMNAVYPSDNRYVCENAVQAVEQELECHKTRNNYTIKPDVVYDISVQVEKTGEIVIVKMKNWKCYIEWPEEKK
jgi:hypothetical protein